MVVLRSPKPPMRVRFLPPLPLRVNGHIAMIWPFLLLFCEYGWYFYRRLAHCIKTEHHPN